MSKGFITGTNEELIKAYKESRDESYLKELIEANKGNNNDSNNDSGAGATRVF